MEIRAVAKYIRISPKKIRLVVDLIRDMSLNKAIETLSFLPHRAARPLLKVINSAIANAENNFGLKKEDLQIKSLIVNQGPALKRWVPKARGVATPIKRRSSHITVILAATKAGESIKKPEEKKEKRKVAKSAGRVTQPVSTQKIKETHPSEKPEVFDRTRLGSDRHKQHLDKVRLKEKGGSLKRIFRRKAI